VKYSTDEIIVTGTRLPTDIYSSPSKVDIFDRKQIQNMNGEKLSDILKMSGGVYLKSYGGNSSLKTLSYNGMSVENVLILLDGIRMNSFQNSLIDLSLISKDNIERVEVINNGYSSVYGSDAAGGVVNVVTRNDYYYKNDFNVNFENKYGSYGYKKFFLDVSKRFDKLEFGLKYTNESSNDDFDYFYFDGVSKLLKQRDNSDYNLAGYNMTVLLPLSKHIRISFYSDYIDIDKSIPGVETGSPSSKVKQLDRNWNNILSYENNLSKKYIIKSNFNFQNNLMNYNNGTLVKSYYKNIVYTSNSQLDYKAKNFRASVGYDLSYATLKSNDVEDNVDRVQTGIYFVSEIELLNNGSLKIFPSVRYDNYSDIHKNYISSKIGFNYKPFENTKLHIRSGVGNNLRAPTFNELYWIGLGNKELNPERSVNFDAGMIFNFDFVSNNTIDLTYTFIDANDKIIWRPTASGIWQPQNISNSRSDVISTNLNIAKEFSTDVYSSLTLKYSYTSSINKSSDYLGDPSYYKQIFYIPKNNFKINFELFVKKIGLNFYYNLLGKRYTDLENINSLPATELLDGNIFVNFRLLDVAVQSKLEINNILNKNYQLISGYPMPLRNYKLGFSLTY
jgi:outer membrane cobalamin receptor